MDEATQVSNSQVRFTLQWEGVPEVGIPVALEVLLEANQDDPDLCTWLRAAPLHGCRITGGGSAPACHFRRVL